MAETYEKINWSTKTRKLGSYMISARELSIVYEADQRYWRWHKLPEDPDVEVAELIRISNLYVEGTAPMNRFFKRERYEVLFVLKRTKSAKLSTAADLILELPDGTEKKKVVDIMMIPPDQWVFVKVGSFTHYQKTGHIRFSLQVTDRTWKEGLFIGGVLIQHIA